MCFNYLRYIPGSEITGSDCNSKFKILKNSQTVSKVIAPFFPHQQCMKIPMSPHPHQYSLLSVFFIKATLVDVESYLMVLIYISCIINYAEHLFMCLLKVCISSLGKCLFRHLAHFLVGLFITF